MSYKTLSNILEKRAEDLMARLNDFCESVEARVANRELDIEALEGSYSVCIQREIGIDYEKKIYSLKTGAPRITIDTGTGRMTAYWNSSKQVCVLPKSVAEKIHMSVQQSIRSADPELA